MSETQRRSLRTFMQTLTPGVLIALYTVFAPDAYKPTPEQAVALSVVGTTVWAFVVNLINDTGSNVPLMPARHPAPEVPAPPQ